MSRIDDILVRARDSLSDHKKERWSDARLLRLVDEAQKDLARHSKLLKGETTISLLSGIHTYSLPTDLWLITRAAFDDYEIPLLSYDQMDERAKKAALSDDRYKQSERLRGYSANYGNNYFRTRWEVVTGPETESLIVDNRDMDEIRLYPIPNDDVAQNAYEFENNGSLEFVGDEVFGVVTSIDNYTFYSDFGVLTDLYDPAIETETFYSDLGVVTLMTESDAKVSLWYIRIPDTVTSTESTLEMPSMFDTAMRLYVVGNAYLDDNDAAYRQKGQDTLVLYDRELGVVQETSAKDGTRNQNQYTTTYRSPFE